MHFFFPCHMASGILVSPLEIEPGHSVAKAQSPNQWTDRNSKMNVIYLFIF